MFGRGEKQNSIYIVDFGVLNKKRKKPFLELQDTPR